MIKYSRYFNPQSTYILFRDKTLIKVFYLLNPISSIREFLFTRIPYSTNIACGHKFIYS